MRELLQEAKENPHTLRQDGNLHPRWISVLRAYRNGREDQVALEAVCGHTLLTLSREDRKAGRDPTRSLLEAEGNWTRCIEVPRHTGGPDSLIQCAADRIHSRGDGEAAWCSGRVQPAAARGVCDAVEQ